jgi:hypothetical protein
MSRREIEHLEHRLLPLAHRKAADRIAVESRYRSAHRRWHFAQVLVKRALLDAEQRRAAACSPPASKHRGLRLAQRIDISIERADSSRGARSSGIRRKAITMSDPSSRWISIERSGVSRWRDPSRWLAKVTPSSVILRSVRQAHHLIAAAVGQDRAVPVHEPVQAAQPRHAFRAGAQHQVIGVAQDDVGARARTLSAGFIALTVAAVPTGMKAGVRISPRCIWIVPVRALPSWRKVKRLVIDVPKCAGRSWRGP